MKISRQAYSDMYGPTVGDRLRLADTELWIEIEADRTHYGDEVKFGGGKVIRDGMGQSQASREFSVDTVITNAVIIDHWGIIKADVGLKDGRIHAIGKAGNPDTQSGVDIVIGPGTEVIAGENCILTAGGIDGWIGVGNASADCGFCIRLSAAEVGPSGVCRPLATKVAHGCLNLVAGDRRSPATLRGPFGGIRSQGFYTLNCLKKPLLIFRVTTGFPVF